MGCLWSAFKAVFLTALAFVSVIVLAVSAICFRYDSNCAADMKKFIQESTAEADLTVTEIMFPDRTAYGQYQDADGVLHTDVPIYWHTTSESEIGQTLHILLDPSGDHAVLLSDYDDYQARTYVFLIGIVVSSAVLLLIILYTILTVRRLIKQRKQEKLDEENMIKEIMERNQYD